LNMNMIFLKVASLLGLCLQNNHASVLKCLQVPTLPPESCR
jgi:hypothetical protein